MTKQKQGLEKKWLLITVSGTMILLVLLFLAYDLIRTPSTPCDTVFQQTSIQLGLKLKHLDSEGSLLLGRQKIQDLTEQAQLTALNLKTCCVVLDSGNLNASQFLECKNTANSYAKRLDTIINQLTQVNKAQQANNPILVAQTKQQIETEIQAAKASAEMLEEQIELITKEPMAANSAGIYFQDEFTSAKLNPDWQVRAADLLRWKQQAKAGSLLITTQKGSIRGGDSSLKNQFVLNRIVPEENFEIIVKAAIQIQGQQNSLSVALWQDNDHYLEIGYRGFIHGNNIRRSPYFSKEVQGQRNLMEGSVKGYGGVLEMEVVYLKIERMGNKFIGSYAYGDPATQLQDLRWTKIGTHVWIDFYGRPALWADNGAGTAPEVPVEFDYVLIRKIGP